MCVLGWQLCQQCSCTAAEQTKLGCDVWRAIRPAESNRPGSLSARHQLGSRALKVKQARLPSSVTPAGPEGKWGRPGSLDPWAENLQSLSSFLRSLFPCTNPRPAGQGLWGSRELLSHCSYYNLIITCLNSSHYCIIITYDYNLQVQYYLTLFQPSSWSPPPPPPPPPPFYFIIFYFIVSLFLFNCS